VRAGGRIRAGYDRAMRILMLAQSYAPVVGGEERVVEELSAELAGRGHSVAVATLRQPAGEPEAERRGVRVHTLRGTSDRIPMLSGDGERRHAPPLPDPETVLDLRRVLREERPEVVHAHNWLLHSYLPLDRRSQAALALSLHDYGLLCATQRLIHRGAPCSGPGPFKCIRCAADHYGAKGPAIAVATRLGERRVRRRVDIFLPISRAVAEHCRLGPGDRFEVVPNFIGELPPAPAPDDPRLAELPEEPFILSFGDQRPDKGTQHLLDAYARLGEPPPLVLIGRWMFPEPLRAPGVTALGPWPQALAVEALRRSLFTVAPSIWPEPFGLVALESAAAGKAIVASDTGGLRDVVADQETGLLIGPGDREHLAAAMRRLIDDEGLRARLGEAATKRARLFSPETIVPRFEEAYEVAFAARRSRSR
jgi:glycosyltransferase involved in cell wall biosynthesis